MTEVQSLRDLDNNRVNLEQRIDRIRDSRPAGTLHDDAQDVTILPLGIHISIVPVHLPRHRPLELKVTTEVRRFEGTNRPGVGSEEAEAALGVEAVLNGVRDLARVHGEGICHDVAVGDGDIQISDGAGEFWIYGAVEVEGAGS